MKKLPILIPLLLLLAGCPQDILGPDDDGLEFSWEADGHGEWLEQPEVTATGGEGTIRVESRLSAPDPCQSLSAEVTQSGSGATLRVRIEGDGEPCTDQIGTFRYEAAMEGLPPGEYDLEVVHEYPGTGWPSGPVHEERLTVR